MSKEYAEELGIAPGIVVGRLHYDGLAGSGGQRFPQLPGLQMQGQSRPHRESDVEQALS